MLAGDIGEFGAGLDLGLELQALGFRRNEVYIRVTLAA